MNKKLLNKISIIFTAAAVLLACNTAYAAPSSIVTYSPIEVPITTQSFVFKESFGSIEDDFTDVFAEVEAFLNQNGAIATKRAILYLDYGVDRVNPGKFKSAQPPSDRSPIEYLNDIYGESTLKTYRRVLVGYLVPPQFYISPSGDFKEYTLSSIKVLAFQAMDKNVKTPLSVLTAPPGTIPTDNENTYSQSDRLYDKLNMMNYLALHVEYSSNIGMMEMYDERLDVYTFMAIPGNQTAFLTGLGLPLSAEPGMFKRRSDVAIADKSPQNAAEAPAANNDTQAAAPIAAAP
ncbi:MAG: hypothetical protein FWE18_03420 [Alphaproteobacteria bacterium]|nr:hypothetical protein [Alphaproteobacteria bacterium]